MNEIVERAHRFAETHVAPNAAKWAREGRMQVEALRAAAGEGLLAFQTSKAWGGHEIGFAAKLKLLEVLSRHSYDFAFSLTNTAGCAAHLAEALPRAVAERYVPAMLKGERFGGSALSEPGAGSDFAGIKTRAVKDGDGWVLTGEKGWITNAAFGDVFITYAQTDPAQGWKGIGCFLVDGRREGSLLHTLDLTSSSMGARLLRRDRQPRLRRRGRLALRLVGQHDREQHQRELRQRLPDPRHRQPARHLLDRNNDAGSSRRETRRPAPSIIVFRDNIDVRTHGF